MLAYALSIFTGAFLLFQVQPLIGKYILPWFGGSPGVWATCMLFFQTLLLGGYAYAHFSTKHLKPKNQALLHLALLALSLALLPITPADSWKPLVAGDPTWRILALLTVSLGLPYFVLSATGPLMQQWFSQTHPGVSPYRLYALSNVGSLLALLSYPFFFEPAFPRQMQATLWSVGLGLFVVFCGFCAWRLLRHGDAIAAPVDPTAENEAPATPSLVDRTLWLALPAVASVLLLATTNKLCQDVAVIPFLWVLPLSLYLLSFIICFDSPRWYVRWLFLLLLAVGIGAVCHLLFAGFGASLVTQVVGYSGMLFVGCMFCHGELYRLKPHPRHLTSFYLLIATGGALGGFLVAVVAPAVFNSFLELHVSLGLLALLAAVVCVKDRSRPLALAALAGTWLVTPVVPALRMSPPSGFTATLLALLSEIRSFYRDHWWAIGLLALLTVVCFGAWPGIVVRDWRARVGSFVVTLPLVLGVVLAMQIKDSDHFAISASRNFYGVLTVFEYSKADPQEHHFLLQHGKITHGLQFADPVKATWPTSYYGKNSGVGLALLHLPQTKDKRIGLVGLGTGSLAAYGEPGDYLRIYEINPQVQRLARSRFTYLANCAAKVDVIMGDARLSMENELKRHESQQFDLLALDAFSSDAIPVHLLTEEAFATYLQHLKPDGVIAVHISNRYLDLQPVVDNLARHFGLSTAMINDNNEDDWWNYATTWVLVTKNREWLDTPVIRNATTEPWQKRRPVPLWTDDYASLFQILKF
jgi:SAM-dependent methyltransferase